MAAPGVLERLRLRLGGVPRSPLQLDLGLRLWAAYRRLGWFASGSQGARSASGRPVPWWTYAAVQWLDDHLAALPAPPAACLELGSGSSTHWLARRFGEVISLEHDERWVHRLRSTLPANVDLRLVGGDDVEAYLAPLGERDAWDLVVIDGRHRTAALARAVSRMGERSLVLLDDSDRPQYAEAIRALAGEEVARTDFFGFSPAVAHFRCTSIFSRPGFRSRATSPAFFGHGLATYRDL